MFFIGKFTPRRQALLALMLLALGFVAWAWHEGIAVTRGITLQHMDWDNDGHVSQAEFLQAFYAVKVEDTVHGARQCRLFSWRSSGTEFRRDCLTVLKTSP